MSVFPLLVTVHEYLEKRVTANLGCRLSVTCGIGRFCLYFNLHSSVSLLIGTWYVPEAWVQAPWYKDYLLNKLCFLSVANSASLRV